MRFPELRLVEELVSKDDNWEQRQENICIHESAGIEWAQGRPSLDKRQEDIGSKTKVGIPRIPDGSEWQIRICVSLNLPRVPEFDVYITDAPPDQESGYP